MVLVGLKWTWTPVRQMQRATASETGPTKGSVTLPWKDLGSLFVVGLGGLELVVVAVAQADLVYPEIDKTFFKCLISRSFDSSDEQMVFAR